MQRCFFFLLWLLGSTVLYADYPGWLNYTSGLTVTDAVVTGSHVWLATRGGVTRIDRQTETMQFYNRSNSGLQDNDVRCAVADAAGTLWFGTMNDGLASFDGTTWRTFTTRNSNLPSGSIRALATDGTTVWIGTWGRGVIRFDGSDWTEYSSQNSELPGDYISALYIDTKGTVWVGTENTGLTTFDGTNWSRFNDQGNIPFATVLSIAEAEDGSFWFGTGNNTGSGGGVVRWHNDTWTAFTMTNSALPGNVVSSIHTDNMGTVWFATNKGLAALADTSWTLYTPSSSDAPVSVVTGDASSLWAGTRGGGAMELNGTEWRMWNPSNSGLPGNSVADMQPDANGGMWIAVPGGGLVYTVDQKEWTSYTTDNSGLPDNRVYDIALDHDGTLWCATYGGIGHFDGTNWQAYTPANTGIPAIPLTCIAVAADGDIWAGTYGAGILRFDGTGWHRYTTSDGLPSVYVTSIAVDSTNTVWAANFTDGSVTGYGVAHFDGTGWTRYTDLPNPSIADIAVDAGGAVWIGTEGGAVRLKGAERQEFTVFNSGLTDQALRAVSVTPDGSVWFGTLNGTTRFDGTNWEHYSTDNSGLPHNFTNRVVLHDGNTWIGTSGGIGVLLAPVTAIPEHISREQASSRPRLALTRQTLVAAFPDGSAGLPAVLRLYDLAGREVSASVYTYGSPGVREIPLTESIPAGTYLYYLRVGEAVYTGIVLSAP